MDWQDSGIILSLARHGEHDAVLEVLTAEHGRHRGFVKAGMSRRQKGHLQPGSRVEVSWYSRLEEGLGRFTVEPVHNPLGALMGDGARLAALSAMVSVVAATLPEREPHGRVYEGLVALLDLLEDDASALVHWGEGLVRLELGVLADLGYGLDLSECAATGDNDNLTYVSPKSGRAVSASAGAPYAERLLVLPPFLIDTAAGRPSLREVANGLALTGFFLGRNVWDVQGQGQPPARERFTATLAAEISRG
uniref:DNA repair protein RecO n=1 Tax=Pseudokordiimonas caeni TaxID=2997908 RepID=UPI002810D5F6|nr:DNA repair protein RecO [Pseudokordiimonas caeni]